MSAYELKKVADELLKNNGFKQNGQLLGSKSTSVWASASAGLPSLGK